LLLAGLLACEGNGTGQVDPKELPTAVDVLSDMAEDVLSDAAIEVLTDVAVDVPPDAAIEVPPDTASDVLPEAALDVELDAALDTVVDVSSDAATDAPSEVFFPTGPARIAVVTDTHLWLDDAHGNNVNWVAAMTDLAGLANPPDRVVSTGDDIDDLFTAPFAVQEWLDGIGDPVAILLHYRGLIETFAPVGFRIVLGNHDVRYFDTFEGNSLPLAAWAKAFEGSPAYPAPWYAEEVRGCRLLMLQSNELATNHADNDLPTFGAAQLAWLDQQLTSDKPVVLFWHVFIEQPAEGQTPPEVMQIIARHAGPADRVVFTGHGHAFHRYLWQGVRFYEGGALTMSQGNVHQVECDGQTGRISILNEADLPYEEGPLAAPRLSANVQ
jgi:hypothetical protein